MSRATALTAMLAMLAGLGNVSACGQTPVPEKVPAKAEAKPAESPAPAPSPAKVEVDPRVTKAAGLAKEIAAKPEEADAVLAKHGLDRDGLDALMFEIAADPKLAAAYREARARE